MKLLISTILGMALSGTVIAAGLEDLKTPYRRPTTIPFPEANPYQAEKAALGKMLFFDPRLSEHQNLSCASCHNPSFGWEAALPASVGAQNTPLPRHSPTILNMAWNKEHYFWDGRARSLEEQALGPITSSIEMNMPIDALVERLKGIEGYQSLFKQVYSDGITANNIVGAIATFERTIVSGRAPFDLWVEGDDSAISEDAKRGFVLFNGKAQCSACHTGWNFTDNTFHDIGLPTEDEGRFAVDASDPNSLHAFKTPGLRNIGQRAPYMHNGSIATLEAVIAHYVSGGIPRPSRSPQMQSVSLTPAEIEDLIAFLETLEGDDKPMTLPVLPL
jgi:cytochrome c peroxidase